MHEPYGFAHYTAAAAWREDGACLHFVCIWILSVAAFFSALPAFAPGLLAVDAPAPDDLYQRIAGEGESGAHNEYAEGQRLAELQRPTAGIGPKARLAQRGHHQFGLRGGAVEQAAAELVGGHIKRDQCERVGVECAEKGNGNCVRKR